MRYENITRAVFLDRQNRFVAHVELGGKTETVHVKNTGRCRELLVPGAEVWLVHSDKPGRKTAYDLVAVRKANGVLFNIDSQAPNVVVREWLERQSFTRIRPEYIYGESRIDFYMEKNVSEMLSSGRVRLTGDTDNAHQVETFLRMGDSAVSEKGIRRYLLEVKGCTLEIDGIGYFPDAPTERGVKHLRELARAAEEGYHAAVAFVIQMDGVVEVRPNVATHPEFGEALDEAAQAGVRILPLRCHVEPDSLEIVEEAVEF